MDTLTLDGPAAGPAHRHLAAGDRLVVVAGTLAIDYLDTTLAWLPEAVRPASRTLGEGQSWTMPCPALVRLGARGGPARVLVIEAPRAGVAAALARRARGLARHARGLALRLAAIVRRPVGPGETAARRHVR